MLELVQLDRNVDKETYKTVFPQLEARLGEAQRKARAAGLPVLVVFEGWDAAGKGELINSLAQSFDPRGFKVHVTCRPTRTENYFPWLWRFQRILPVAGHMGIYDQSWYGRVLSDRIEKRVPRRQWQQAYEDIEEFERQLIDSGCVLVKFWLHIDQDEQRRRFEQIESDPVISWKVGKDEWKRHRHYDHWKGAVEEMLERTGTGHAPWTVVPSTHLRFARMKVFETVIDAIEAELDRRASQPRPVLEPMPVPPPSPTRQETLLDRVDLSLTLSREQYDDEKGKLQRRLFELEHELFLARTPAAIVYEGWDAAGKGGNIRRLTAGLDPRGYEVVPVAAPTAEEKSHHFLWRFWRDLPKAGHITIFDRSWYGRVLVERVEGFASEDEWRRSFREINEFERQLADFGMVLVKFWLHIDADEQLRRFEARQESPDKQWKITDEDWRNREKWRQYERAVVEMLEKTSTSYAPWTILEANCKLHARIKALRTVADALTAALSRR